MPKRIQRRRTKGWRVPDGAVYVGRPTQWANPYRVTSKTPAAVAVEAFRLLLTECGLPSGVTCDIVRHELRGKDLMCWCALDQPCHADVLLEIANDDCNPRKA